MLIHVLRCKLHQARVTRIDKEYEGSLGVSRDLMDAVGLRDFERILVANLENAKRWETYVIGLDEPGQIFINGASAYFVNLGDRLIAMTWAHITEEEYKTYQPRRVRLDENNRIID
jgi:aspartate 1-decarboxylase